MESLNRCARSKTRLLAVLVAAASVSSARLRCCSAISPLLDSNTPLPIGEAGKRERDQEPGREAAGEDVAPPGRAAPAFGNEGLRLRVGSGAPRGREAIQRSASSRAGERNKAHRAARR